MVDDENNKELLDRITIESTLTLKFYCKKREIGEHIGDTIEPKLKQNRNILSEMEFYIKNSNEFNLSQKIDRNYLFVYHLYLNYN